MKEPLIIRPVPECGAGGVGEGLAGRVHRGGGGGSWIGVPSVGPVTIRKGEAEVRRRFRNELEKMIRAIRYLHYSYRTEETYVGWAGEVSAVGRLRETRSIE